MGRDGGDWARAGQLYQWQRAGWTIVHDSPELGWSSIAPAGPGDLWLAGRTMVGGHPQLWHYWAGVWQEAPLPMGVAVYRLQMLGADEGWALTMDRALLHYKAGVWTLVPAP